MQPQGPRIRQRRPLIENLEKRLLLAGDAAAGIVGQVWNDANGDGERQDRETGLPAWIVYLDGNDNGRLDEGERHTRTDARGRYHFGRLEPGTYIVAQQDREGWVQTFPDDKRHKVELDAGQTVDGVNFGNQRNEAAIVGRVWNDQNKNGRHDDGEEGLVGWVVFLDRNNNGQLDDGERHTRSGRGGRYGFEVEPGRYVVAQRGREGWEQTFPAQGGSHDVEVGRGEVYDDAHFGNVNVLGGITGAVWNDRNGDGERQDSEPGLRGWTVFLDQNENGTLDEGERLTRTNERGGYAFKGLEPGTYYVTQADRDGWKQTFPADGGNHEVDLAAGEVVEGLHFGNQNVSGAIVGSVWHDRNGDGERQNDEHGLSGWTVFLDENDNGVLDDGETRTRTRRDGRYGFDGLDPGTYIVAQTGREGWEQTFPDAGGSHRVDVEAGQVIDGVLFGNRRFTGAISGLLWHDRNGDGERQDGEPGLPAWRLYLDDNNNGQPDDGEPQARTGLRGHYEFGGLAAGTYVVRQVTPDGWENTFPVEGFYEVDLQAGEHAEDRNFGNITVLGGIAGNVWFDRDGDGERENDEPGLLGWQVYLDANNNGRLDDGERQTRSGRGGHYHFLGLEPGPYVVRQTPREGWAPTFPGGDGSHQVDVLRGQILEGIDFGNLPNVGGFAGQVWHDVDGDGERGDDEERGLAGWTVFLDDNDNGQLDDGERHTRTGPRGFYKFPELTPGTYLVAQVVPDAWEQTFPANGESQSVEVERGAFVEGVDFGNTRVAGLITGLVWHDRNGNGEREASERGRPGWLVFVDANENGELDDEEPHTRTGLLGHYELFVAPGQHVVAAALRPNWELTFPAEGNYRVDVARDEVVDDIDFGVRTFRNPAAALDVNDDGSITPSDAISVINTLNEHGPCRLLDPGEGEDPPSAAHRYFIDTNGDGNLSAADALEVINHLNVFGSGDAPQNDDGEGEFAGGLADLSGLLDEAIQDFAGSAASHLDDAHEARITLRDRLNDVGSSARSILPELRGKILNEWKSAEPGWLTGLLNIRPSQEQARQFDRLAQAYDDAFLSADLLAQLDIDRFLDRWLGTGS